MQGMKRVTVTRATVTWISITRVIVPVVMYGW